MTADLDDDYAAASEPDLDEITQRLGGVGGPAFGGVADTSGLLIRPINWNVLTAKEAEAAWAELDAWVTWLRTVYGLPPAVIPPFWHRHDELIWELSALHTHWLNAYDPDNSPAAPFAWHRDFADARNRLREWVSTSGTRLDADRPTRHTTWPGETPPAPGSETNLLDRAADFKQFVAEDLITRRLIEDEVAASKHPS